MVVDFETIRGISNHATVRRSRRSDIHKPHFRRYAYGYDKNGKFKTERVGIFRGFWLNRLKVFSRMVVCTQCGRKIKVQARKSQLKAYICARCS